MFDGCFITANSRNLVPLGPEGFSAHQEYAKECELSVVFLM